MRRSGFAQPPKPQAGAAKRRENLAASGPGVKGGEYAAQSVPRRYQCASRNTDGVPAGRPWSSGSKLDLDRY